MTSTFTRIRTSYILKYKGEVIKVGKYYWARMSQAKDYGKKYVEWKQAQ